MGDGCVQIALRAHGGETQRQVRGKHARERGGWKVWPLTTQFVQYTICKKVSADLTPCKCCKTTAKDERGESFLGEKSGKRKKLK